MDLRRTTLGVVRVAAVVAAAGVAAAAALAMTGGLTSMGRLEMSSVPRHTPSRSTNVRVRQEPPRTPTAVGLRLFQIVAARGDCWLTVRDTASTGRVLYEGLLAQGKRLTLRRRLIWLAAGAASNLDVLVDGKPVQNLHGTIETVLPISSP
jgi:RodZ C-terminal domain